MRLIRALSVTLLVVGTVVLTSTPTFAGCAKVNKYNGECLVEITVPGTPPSSGGGSTEPVGDTSGGDDGGGKPKCVNEVTGKNVPCTYDDSVRGGSYWSNNEQCYVDSVQPQPPMSDAIWGGRDYGAIYQCVPYADPSAGFWFWAGTQPAGPAAPPDPGALAQQIVESMRFRAIDIGIVPEPGPSSVGLIGMPAWMWVKQPSASTWGPISESASAGGITVGVTAKVDRVEWDMGDGTVVTCTTPGTPYADHYGKSASPDCGHHYTQTSVDQPENAYTVSATSFWEIEWSGAGQTGTIPMDLTRSTQIRIGEMQVLVTG
jgi:hypothetical protein